MPRVDPTAKNYLGQNVSSAKVILELALCKWENNPVSVLEYQCKLFTCLKKVMLTSHVSDRLSSIESGIFVIHR